MALVGASVMAAAATAPPPADVHIAGPQMQLVTKSVANVPVNLVEAIANVPANELTALNALADALIASDSWQLRTPTNVWGWDPANPAMAEAVVAALVPFPAASGNGGLPSGGLPAEEGPYLGGSAPPGTLGYMVNVLIAAEMPMSAKCPFECPDLIGALKGYFQVPLLELMSGYTFPTVVNPIDPSYPVPWSGQTAAPLDPLEPFRLFADSLTEDPAGITSVSREDVGTTLWNLWVAVDAIFGYVPDSYLSTEGAFGAYPGFVDGLLRGITREACPVCEVPPDFAPVTKAAEVLAPLIPELPDIPPPDLITPVVKTVIAVGLGGDVSRSADTSTPEALAAERSHPSAAATDAGTPTSQQPAADTTPAEELDPTFAASTDVTSDSDLEPGRAPEKDATGRGRGARVLDSVSDRVSSVTSSLFGGVKRGAAAPAGSSPEGSNPDANGSD